MKKLFKSFLVGGLSIAAASALFVGVGSAKEAVEVDAANNDKWYLRGTFNDWTGTEEYEIVEGGEPLIVSLSAGSKFKVVKDKTSWTTDILGSGSGDAFDHWSYNSDGDWWGQDIKNSYDDDGNMGVQFDGKYAFSVKDNALYVDYGEFFYSGDDNSWGITPDADHPTIEVNGGSVVWSLSTNESFKIRYRNDNNGYNYGCFGYSNLKNGDFYGSFTSPSNNNIKTLIADHYDVSVSMTNRTWTVRAVPQGVDPEARGYVYVLDKYGDLLNTNHYAELYDTDGRTTGEPGAQMSVYSGTNHMYQIDYAKVMEKVKFNNTTTYSWEWDISGTYSKEGKCLILDGTEDEGKWSSDTWVYPETAKFIENCMHFANYKEDQKGDGKCVSEGWYTTAKKAYEALDPTYKEELSGLDYVVARLDAWAVAYNNSHFTVTSGIGAFGAPTVNPMNSIETNNAFAIIAIASITLVTLGGVFILRRKEN